MFFVFNGEKQRFDREKQQFCVLACAGLAAVLREDGAGKEYETVSSCLVP
jgi:hypothetical protein